jgi:hypothetical protein
MSVETRNFMRQPLLTMEIHSLTNTSSTSEEDRILKSDIETVGGACVSYLAEEDLVIPFYLQSVLVHSANCVKT